jgi:hypothetical protein
MSDSIESSSIKGENLHGYWPSTFSIRAIIFSLIMVIGISLYFSDYFMPTILFTGGLLVIIGFFCGLYYFPYAWRSLGNKNFYQKLFLYSFLFRVLGLLYTILIVFLFEPSNYLYELGARDSWFYHIAGLSLRNLFIDGKWINFLLHYAKDKSDWGFCIYTGLIYFIFGPYVIAQRIMNCLWGSITVVLIAKIAGRTLSFEHAKLSGIIAMIMPPFLWFAATGLKETFMIFMFTTVFYYASKIMESGKINILGIVLMILFTFFLFFFRTFLGVITMVLTFIYFGLNLTKKRRSKITIIVVFIIFMFGSGYLLYQGQFFESILSTYEERTSKQDVEWNKASKDLKINFKMAVIAPIAFAGAIITPLPSFLLLEKRQIPIIAHFQNEIIRNILYYFVFLGLFYLFRNNFARCSLIILFPLSYIFVLATAGVAFQDRFVLPSLPFFIILMSVGLINSSSKWIKRWDIYLFIIFIAEIAWNVFKLNNRGLI